MKITYDRLYTREEAKSPLAVKYYWFSAARLYASCHPLKMRRDAIHTQIFHESIIANDGCREATLHIYVKSLELIARWSDLAFSCSTYTGCTKLLRIRELSIAIIACVWPKIYRDFKLWPDETGMNVELFRAALNRPARDKAPRVYISREQMRSLLFIERKIARIRLASVCKRVR